MESYTRGVKEVKELYNATRSILWKTRIKKGGEHNNLKGMDH